MATTTHIASDTNTAIDFSADGDTYIVDAGVTMSVSGDNTFFGATSFSQNTIQVLGTVETTTSEPTILIRGSNTDVKVGDAGSVLGQSTAVWLTGPKGTVANNGTIDATDFAIKIDNIDSFVKNNDTITSDATGIRIQGTGGEIENYGTITADVGVKGFSDTGDTLSLFNKGTITGSLYSFSGAAENDTVINQGTMVGDIFLLGGNDSFNGTGGTVTGTVFGGFGDDTYTVDSTKLVITEVAGQGDDKVISSVTYRLKGNIEALTLSGRGDIDGTGNGLDNVLTGNTGANTLKGGGGEDHIVGGRGNDTLEGDAGSDTFVFGNRSGKDKVADFVPEGANHDVIDLTAVSAITSFADLKANHLIEKVGVAVIIHIDNANTITLDDVRLSDLHANDFLF